MSTLKDLEEKEIEENGRRVKIWRLARDLGSSTVDRFASKIESLQTAYYLRFSFGYNLRNIETDELRPYYKYVKDSSGLMTNFGAARDWLEARDEERLQLLTIERPNTKWTFVSWLQVQVKAILTDDPLLGAGKLPEWLRQKKGLYALDSYNDNLCVFRCIAVHFGARPDRSTNEAVRLATEYYGTDLVKKKLKLKALGEVEKKFKVGIRVYEPSEDGIWRLIRQPAHYDAVRGNDGVMTIGFYNKHAFLIKDIKKVANVYACGGCSQRFTQACNLQRHASTCQQGKTVFVCKGKKIEKPQSAYEKAFYPKNSVSFKSIKWLEKKSQEIGRHIHHARCGHGGEREIAAELVDGYDPIQKTVFQFHGCYFHGCPSHCKRDNQSELYENTTKRDKKIKDAGYELVVMWECNFSDWGLPPIPEPPQVIYPHFIVYDFEAYHDKSKAFQPTNDLLFDDAHVPISVSISDTYNKETTHLCERDPSVLVKAFVDELTERAEAIGEEMWATINVDDFKDLSKYQSDCIARWLEQVPVLGFNSGKYDLNLIKTHFVSEISNNEAEVKVAKKAAKTMYISTSTLKFLDVTSYIGPGTSYEKWVKAYDCTLSKSWFPYEWFDNPDKLDYPGLPDYIHWYSRLKGGYLLTLEEWKSCKRVFREKQMSTFADWLRYYNNLDVEPFVEAAVKMRAIYGDWGIDVFKDAVSLPGVSMQYLLRGPNKHAMYAPEKEAYSLLKSGVSGGPSIVFTRYHEAGVTKIRSHQYKDAEVCRKILGYDASALYLSVMAKDMPCGKETVVNYEDATAAATTLSKMIVEDKFFGFVQCKIFVPEELWPKFEEMCPLFVSKPVSIVSEGMKNYLKKTGRKQVDSVKLIGALSADKMLLYTPLIKWYLAHGLRLEAVYSSIEYQRHKIFEWFVDQVTEARRTGDTCKEKSLLADVYKLLGNSAYGKLIEALEKQTGVIYTKNEYVVDANLRSNWFEDLTEIGDAYEIEMRKSRVKIDRPFQIGIAVYQLAKLRILEFYYDFVDYFVDRRHFELIQMDTDSLYFALSANQLEQVIRPELKEEFEATKNSWLAWDAYSNRTPGLFKLEFSGHRAIALCSKCYFVDGDKKSKHSSKGMSARYNRLSWDLYKATLAGSIDKAENIGFRMRDGQICTYEQQKLGLSAYYDKRLVLPDGIHTVPLEYGSSVSSGITSSSSLTNVLSIPASL